MRLKRNRHVFISNEMSWVVDRMTESQMDHIFQSKLVPRYILFFIGRSRYPVANKTCQIKSNAGKSIVLIASRTKLCTTSPGRAVSCECECSSVGVVEWNSVRWVNSIDGALFYSIRYSTNEKVIKWHGIIVFFSPFISIQLGGWANTGQWTRTMDNGHANTRKHDDCLLGQRFIRACNIRIVSLFSIVYRVWARGRCTWWFRYLNVDIK